MEDEEQDAKESSQGYYLRNAQEQEATNDLRGCEPLDKR